LNPDPDPAFQVDSDPYLIWIHGVDDHKLKKKNIAEKFLNVFCCNLLMSTLQEKPSALKKEHPTLQKMKSISFFYVCASFLPS
jgi:hypothetical protein